MAELTKTADIAAFPQTESTSNMTTFGCVKHQLSENFNESHRYSAGDTVVYNGRHYQFQSSHYGVWTGSDATLSTEPFISFEPTTRQDLSVITDGLDRLAEETALPPTFSATIEYFAGDRVLYNEVRYEFTGRHYGAWTGTDVTPVETSLFSLNERDDVYPAQIGVSSDNPAMDRTGRRITLHNITDNRVYSLKTGADGYVSFDLKKDCEWTFDGGEIDGYTKGTKVQFVTTAKNPGTDKFHVNYERDTGTVTLTMQLSSTQMYSVSGKQVCLFFPDEFKSFTKSTDNSGRCEMTVPKNKRCIFYCPQLTGIPNPENRILETVSNMDKTVTVIYKPA